MDFEQFKEFMLQSAARHDAALSQQQEKLN